MQHKAVYLLYCKFTLHFDVLLTLHLRICTCARNMQRHEIKLIVKQILCIKLVKY